MTMIKREDIHNILVHNQSQHYGVNYRGDSEVDYRYVKDSDYADVEQALLDLLFEMNAENAELSAKVKAYEAVISNSNFKAVVQRSTK